MSFKFLKYFPFALLAAVFLMACCSNTTTTKVSREADGSVSISSGKNVRLEGLTARLSDGTSVRVDRYEAIADPAVTEAQGRREAQNIKRVSELVGSATEGAAKGVVKGAGVP